MGRGRFNLGPPQLSLPEELPYPDESTGSDTPFPREFLPSRLSQDHRGYEPDMTAHITSPLYYNRAYSPISEMCDLKPTGGVGLRVNRISIFLIGRILV